MDIRLRLYDILGGAPVYVLGTWTTSGIVLTEVEGDSYVSQAYLRLFNPSGGEPTNILVSLHDDGTVDIGNAVNPGQASGVIYFETPERDNQLSANVTLDTVGAVTLPATLTVTGSGAPTYDSARVVNGTTFDVRFSEKVQSSDFTAGVTVNVNAAPVVIASATLQANGSTVRYVIPAFSDTDVITWEYDHTTGDIADQTDGTVLGDVTAKTVTNGLHTLYSSSEIGTVAATTVVVTFADNVAAAGDDYSTGVTINVNAAPAVIASGTRQANHKVVRYVVPAVDANDVVTWEYSQAAGVITSEDNGALMGDITAKTATNNVAEVPPEFSAAEIGVVNATTVATTFTEKVAAVGNDYTTGITIKVNTVAAVIASGTRQADHHIVYYVIPAVDADDVVTIEYDDTTGIIKQEDDGSSLATFAAQPVTNTVPGVAPTFVSAEVGTIDNTTVEAIFSVNLKAAGDDYTTGVTIKKNAAAQAISAGVRQADHTKIRYTIPAVANGDAVTIEYDDTTGLIQNEADSEPLATFGAQAVTNNVP